MMTTSILARELVSRAERWQQPELSTDARYTQGPANTVQHIEALERQAHDEGYERGLSEGRAQAQEELRQRLGEIEGLLDHLVRPLEDLDDELESQLVEMTVAMAKQLIRRELRTQPDEIIAVVREALAVLPAASRCLRVRLHPEDAVLVREVLQHGDSHSGWSIEEDPLLERGGCVVQGEHSEVDARLDKRIGAVVHAVWGGSRDADRPEPES